MSSHVYQNEAYRGITQMYLTPSAPYESVGGSTWSSSTVLHEENTQNVQNAEQEEVPSHFMDRLPGCKSPPWWGWAILVVGILIVATLIAIASSLSGNKGTTSGVEELSPSTPSTDGQPIPPAPPTRPGANKCDAIPCKHDGTCNTWEHDPGYYCWCQVGFTGHNCDVPVSATTGEVRTTRTQGPPPPPSTRTVPPPPPTSPKTVLPPTSPENMTDCSEADISGIYIIYKSGLKIKAYCHIDETGKWTVIQRREDGSVDFKRTWLYYSVGFGNLAGEHWLGNDNIHALTTAGLTQLRVDLEDWENTRYTVYYNVFLVAGAGESYRLTVGDFDGFSPPDNALLPHNGRRFTTTDTDYSCEHYSGGGWWYTTRYDDDDDECVVANLNGEYNNTRTGRGINWYFWKGLNYSLRKAAMMIRKA